MQLPDETIEYQYQRLLTGPGRGMDPLPNCRRSNFLPEEKLDAIEAPENDERPSAGRSPPSGSCRTRRLRNLHAAAGRVHRPAAEDAGRLSAARATPANSAGCCAGQPAEGELWTAWSCWASAAATSVRRRCSTPCATPTTTSCRRRCGWASPACTSRGTTSITTALHGTARVAGEHLRRSGIDAEERWGIVVVSKSGGTIETAAAYRAIRAEMAKFYGPKSESAEATRHSRDRPEGQAPRPGRAEGIADDDILTIPDDMGGRYSVFTPVGLLPAAVMGLDVRALLLGAAAMTKRFLEEPFDRNPVLQYAAVNHLMTTEELNKDTRVMAVWNEEARKRGVLVRPTAERVASARWQPWGHADHQRVHPRPAQPRATAPGRHARQGHQQPAGTQPEAPSPWWWG